jgi:tol-pal system protein YbgF
MTIRITTPRAVLALILALAYLGLTPATPAAADREHQQMMADLRMLQEQTQQLQALMNSLGEALKAVNTRLDDQTSLERKAFADGKVQMDAISGDIRIVREKVDETNVRLGTITQELETLRLAIPEPGAIPVAVVPVDSAAAGGDVPPGAPPAPGVAPPTTAGAPQVAPASRVNPQQLWQSSFADYTSGNYSLAVSGFQMYLNSFPKSAQAHEAQLLIGESQFLDKKNAEAVAAYDLVIASYPKSPSVPQAYYKRGLALAALGETDRARESLDTVVKQYPDSQQATLAKQRLETLNRPAR